MAVATYHRDRDGIDLVRLDVASADAVAQAVRAVLGARTSIGYPTLEVRREDGSSLSLSTDGRRALLVHVDADGRSYSSVGEAPDGEVFVFDYRGSWSEASGANTVGLTVAVRALAQFVEGGVVAPDLVAFEPD